MPEGPEIECTKLSLQPIIGKKIKEIKLSKQSQKYQKYKNKQAKFNDFIGCKIIDIRREGKFLIWLFNTKQVILNHLGMSGKWIFLDEKKQELPKHTKIILSLENFHKVAIFDDVRNFGQFRTFEIYDSVMEYYPIRKMGIDGLAVPFPLEDFLLNLDKTNYTNREIGKVLLDQKLVAGIGNIYKAESLYAAKIDPTRLVQDLSVVERKKLGNEISRTLHKALVCQGSSFNIQPFQNPFGEEGTAQNWHKVYGKKDQPCQECNTKIVQIKQNGRSTCFCPKCQK